MNDKPARTMMLSPYEWRSLVIASATNLYQYTNTVTAVELPPNGAQVQWLHDTLDRLKMQVSAWSASGQQPTVSQDSVSRASMAANETIDQITSESASRMTAAMNGTGSASPKKKRGWQKGRKRGPRKPKGNEAVQ